MPLSNINTNVLVQWQLQRANAGFGTTNEGPDSLNFTLGGINTTTFNQIATLQYSIAAAGTQTVDLTSLQNLVYESFSLAHALTLFVLPSGSSVQIQPGTTNPLNWFMNSGAVLTIPAGGMFLYSEPVAGPGAVVDSTHKTLLFTNNGGSTLTLDLVILGGTT